MEQFGTRENLRARLIDAFAAREEIYRICVFGREVEGIVDSYSDIDLIVYSNDLACAKSRYLDTFSSIAPIRARFCLGGGHAWYAEMLMLHGFSPYQKVDFSIGDAGLDPQRIRLQVVYECTEKARTSETALVEIPKRRDAVDRVMDSLFSVPRFTKCLFRRDLDMYRRWAGTTNTALALLYEKHFGWQPETQSAKLGSQEMASLHAVLSPEEKDCVHIIHPPDGQLNLALSYQASVKMINALCREKAKYQGLAFDESMVAYIEAFLDSEIARFLHDA